jgi:guanylate kinase|tara:strand:+ start:17362 stop:17979 length:618 start_codon:yes stop_codon:yes gene_type:complete
MSNSGKLIIFAAPSGAGKSSFIKKIIKDSKNNLQLSVSATTRLPRGGEIHGKDYFFISEKEFNELKNNQAFLEFANVHGHQYGTIKSFVDERLGEGIHVILDIDVQGFTQIQRAITKDIVSIFIIPPSFDELKRRLILRGLDSNDAIDKRLENARKELEQAENFDYLVLNDDFNMAYNEITSIIFDKDYEYNVTNNKNILKDLLN